MLKELLRERLVAAADDIFALFESTVASYKEQLCRAREETERHRRQLEAVCKTRVVIRVRDVEQLIGHQEELADVKCGGGSSRDPGPPRIKEEEEEAGVTRLPPNAVPVESEQHRDEASARARLCPSGDHCGGPAPDTRSALPADASGSAANGEADEQEADVGKLPLTGVSVKSEEPRRSQLQRRSPGQEDLLAPVSDSDGAQGPLTSGAGGKRSKSSPKWDGPDKRTSRKRKKRPALKEHFSCSACRKRFTCKSHWMRHVKTHTGEKSFCCSVCGKTFSRKEHVELHMRTHTGEKPFACSVCGATFSVKQSMKKHMRRHTGEKPFACSFCRTAFSRKESLDKHMRVHTGEKPFSCSVCGGSFAQRSNMTRHMQIHKKAE